MNFLKVYTTPLQRPKITFYVGRRRIGMPYFVPKKLIGFTRCRLGYKTKWTSDDYRFEWNPGFSFVFFDFQIAVSFTHKFPAQYWEGFLYYHFETEGDTEERLRWAISGFPMIHSASDGENRYIVTYWDKIVRKKYVDLATRETRRKYIETLR